MTRSIHDAALAFHTAGIAVTPVRADHTKAPIGKTWQKRVPTRDDIDHWFAPTPTGQPRHTAIGVVTGTISGNLEMIEVEGNRAHRIKELAATAHDSGLGPLWDTINNGWLERSPSGGYHWFYRVDGTVSGNTKLAMTAKHTSPTGHTSQDTIAETRGTGGQVVVAPTGGHAHETGRPWQLLIGGPETVPTITATDRDALHDLFATLNEHTPTPTPAQPVTKPLTGTLATLTTPTENNTIFGTSPGDDFEHKTTWADILIPAGWTHLYDSGGTSYWRRPGKTGDGISATTGHAGDRDRLFVFSTATEFPNETPITKFGAYATLHHGGDFQAAAAQLRRDGYGDEPRVPIHGYQPPTPAPTPAPTSTPAPAVPASNAAATVTALEPATPTSDQPALTVHTFTLGQTDDANAAHLLRLYGDHLRYDTTRGRWYVWDTTRWAIQPSSGGRAREYAKQSARQLPENGADPKALIKHKRYSLSERGISATLSMAATDPDIAITSRDLDAHAYELNTPAGIVDLKTGTLHPHDPTKLHTRITTVSPDPDADTTLWDQFLTQTFPDPAVRDYVQRLAGYSSIGEVRAHILPFAHGTGGNGKGVFLEAMRGVLGDYAGAAPAGFLMATTYQQHHTELADLEGRRFVICSEVNQRDRFDEARVKQLTGGDTVKARFMRQDFFEFTPTHHLWLMGNDKPDVEAGGESFWRRLRLIPFTHKVPEDKVIEGLQEKLAREHGAGVLQWIIDGAVTYLDKGLNDPATVMAATHDYAENMDTIGRFIEDSCHLNDQLSVEVSHLRAAYETWCDEQGERPKTGRAFTEQLARHGVKVGRAAPRGSGGRRRYGGIALASREEDPRTPEGPDTDENLFGRPDAYPYI